MQIPPLSVRVMSSMLGRKMRVAGWVNSSIRQAATREHRAAVVGEELAEQQPAVLAPTPRGDRQE
jgi:hypothetical protein